jgi:hypothetical protein
MSSACRWASYLGEPEEIKAPSDLVSLPASEQVARGQELMQILFQSDSVVAAGAPEMKAKEAKRLDVDWNIVVKQTFIEVVIPPCERSMRRSVSDSALLLLNMPEQPWKSLTSEKIQDMSDASTNVSIEADDRNSGADVCWSSEDEGDAEAFIQPSMPYQYVESWWMPMGYDTLTESSSSTCYGMMSQDMQSCAAMYSQESMYDSSSFMPMQWSDQSINVDECNQDPSQEWRTTVMIRNMPNNYTRDMLLELVDSIGFAGTYDFAYLPIDFNSQAGLGYAFINFATVADAQNAFERFEGFSNWKVPSEKVCTVTWSSPTQGLAAHIERYKNSPVMHHSLADQWKPVLFQQGMRVAFPPPSKPIKTPKVRQHPSAKNA